MIKLFEKYNSIQDVKDEIFVKAVNTNKIDIIDFFLDRGYDINAEKALYNSSYYPETFKHLLEKGANPDDDDLRYRLKAIDVQKALIDLGKEEVIFDRFGSAGFVSALKYDPKYKDTVEQYENIEKYNL